MSHWTLGFVLGGVVVVIVAALLITILVVAHRIASLARTALDVAGEIESVTEPIGALGTANTLLEDIVRTVRSVDGHVCGIADRLSGGGS